MKTLLLILLLVPMMSFGQRAGNRSAGEVIYLFDLHRSGGHIKVHSFHGGAYGGSTSEFTIKMSCESYWPEDNPLKRCYDIDKDIILYMTSGDAYYDDYGNEYTKSTEDITRSFDDDWTVDLVDGYYIVSQEFILSDQEAMIEDGAELESLFFTFHIEKSSGDLRKISFTTNNETDCISGTFSDAYVLERKRY